MITAIITTCRRPQMVSQIIESLRNQKIPPTKIWVYYNGSKKIKVDCDQLIVSNRSDLSIQRFSVGMAADDEFVYFLDDDTVPAKNYTQACLECMDRHGDVILGSSGIVLKNLTENDVEYHGFRFWDRIPKYTDLSQDCLIDYPLHSYFLRKSNLHYLFDGSMDGINRGAEIRLAARAWIKNKIESFVPIQTIDSFGSIVASSQMDQALYLESSFSELRAKVLNAEINRGWLPIFMRKFKSPDN